VDEDFACTVFRSCRKVSLVAQASLQSSKSFLDFLGVNGQNSSLSSIVFQFEALDNSTTTSNPLNIFNKNINCASHIITISEFSKNEIVNLMSYPEERITAIPLGVDERFFDKLSSEQIQSVLNKF
jgi:hypothetical protein